MFYAHSVLKSKKTQYWLACITQRTTDSGANFWVGLARGGDGGFGWVDGTPFDLEFWLDGEPNSSVSDNDDLNLDEDKW